MLTFGRRVSANMMQSATSSALQRAAHRDVGVDGLRPLLVAVEAHGREVGLDEAGRDVRHAHRPALQVVAQRSRVPVHGELRRDVRRAVRVRPDAGDRAEVDDVPVAARRSGAAGRAASSASARARSSRSPRARRSSPASQTGSRPRASPALLTRMSMPAELGERRLDEALAAAAGIGDVEVAVAARAGVHARPGLRRARAPSRRRSRSRRR